LYDPYPVTCSINRRTIIERLVPSSAAHLPILPTTAAGSRTVTTGS
jgi:hypothetical protein